MLQEMVSLGKSGKSGQYDSPDRSLLFVQRGGDCSGIISSVWNIRCWWCRLPLLGLIKLIGARLETRYKGEYMTVQGFAFVLSHLNLYHIFNMIAPSLPGPGGNIDEKVVSLLSLVLDIDYMLHVQSMECSENWFR